jgi:hypothetical protein
MRSVIALILLAVPALTAQDRSAGSFSGDANPVLRIVQALAETKEEQLKPNVYDHDGTKTSYHLSSVRYLGTITRGSQFFTVGTALLIRSSPKGRERPPARGHGFLLLLDQKNRITSYCTIDFPDQVELIGNKLHRIGKMPFESAKPIIADLGLADIPSRTRGFLIEGDAFLPYPFSDRILKPDIQSNQEGEQDISPNAR